MKKRIIVVIILTLSFVITSLALARVNINTRTCYQEAAEKYETTVISAYDRMTVTISSALLVRKDALIEAWGKEERKERRKAIRDARKAYRQAERAAKKEYRKTTRETRRQFYQDCKNCKVSEHKEGTCLKSGGQVTTSLCCKLTGDYPNLCLIGPCGCSPDNSHQVKICDCGEGKCFNGKECVIVK